MSPYRVSNEEFERLIHKALAEIPEEFLEYLDNLSVTFEDEPPDDMADTMGIYEGVPMVERGYGGTLLPDSITIFKGPVERSSDSIDELADQIKKTVLHEIGHFFGLEEDQVDHL